MCVYCLSSIQLSVYAILWGDGSFGYVGGINLGSQSAWKIDCGCIRGSYSESISSGQQITAYIPRTSCSYQQLLSISWENFRGKCLLCPGNKAKNQPKCPTGWMTKGLSETNLSTFSLWEQIPPGTLQSKQSCLPKAVPTFPAGSQDQGTSSVTLVTGTLKTLDCLFSEFSYQVKDVQLKICKDRKRKLFVFLLFKGFLSEPIHKFTKPWAGKVTQWITHLLCKQEN